VFRFQKISNYGTATPAVAQTFAQGCELLHWFQCESKKVEQAKEILLELQRQAVRCTEQRDTIARECETAVEEAHTLQAKQPSGNNAVVIPGVGDLQNRAESFLQAAKLAIAATGNLVEPFYQKRFGHNYKRFSGWTSTEFGQGSLFHQVVSSWEPFVKQVVDMRNAVDHPNDRPGGKLVIENFDVLPSPNNTPQFRLPQWFLLGQAPMPLLRSMDHITESIIVLREMVLVRLFYEFKPPFPVEVREIPPERRDPKNVKRLEVTFTGQ
jgi:hypothetical protein